MYALGIYRKIKLFFPPIELCEISTMMRSLNYKCYLKLRLSMCWEGLMEFHHNCLFKIIRKNQNIADKWMDGKMDGWT